MVKSCLVALAIALVLPLSGHAQETTDSDLSKLGQPETASESMREIYEDTRADSTWLEGRVIAATNAGHLVPTTSQIDKLGHALGLARLTNWVQSALKLGPHSDQMIKIAALAVTYERITSYKYPGAQPDLVASLIKAHGVNRVESTVIDAINGDTNADTILADWIAEAALSVEPPASGRQPIYDTALQPPVAAQTANPIRPEARPLHAVSNRPAHPVQAQRVPANQASNRVTAMVRQEPSPAQRNTKPECYTHEDDQTQGAWPNQSAASEVRDVAPRGDREYDQVNVYGNDVAIQFERSQTKDRSATTINIKCARAKSGGKTRNGCDWLSSIVVMLTPHEVQMVLAVLMGRLAKFRAAGHGPNNDKWFEVEETSGEYAGSIRFTVAQGKGTQADIRKCNVTSIDAGEVAAVFLRSACDQLRMSDSVAMAIACRAGMLHARSQEARQSRQQGMRRAG